MLQSFLLYKILGLSLLQTHKFFNFIIKRLRKQYLKLHTAIYNALIYYTMR